MTKSEYITIVRAAMKLQQEQKAFLRLIENKVPSSSYVPMFLLEALKEQMQERNEEVLGLLQSIEHEGLVIK